MSSRLIQQELAGALSVLDQHISHCELIVTRQRARVAGAERTGNCVPLLQNFETALNLKYSHRATLGTVARLALSPGKAK